MKINKLNKNRMFFSKKVKIYLDFRNINFIFAD